MSAFEDALAKAQAATDGGDPGLAGRYFVAAAGMASDMGQQDVARQIHQLAGDSFRRADRPVDAVNSLHLALSVPVHEPARGPARVILAGVLTAILRFDAAKQQCERVEGPARVAALDSLCSIALAYGDRDSLDAAIEALINLPSPTAGLAAALRSATRERLDGALDRARVHFQALLPELNASPGGRGAVWAEIAEVQALQADPKAAGSWAEALACFQQAGRRSLVLQAELGRVRSLLSLGLSPLEHKLFDGLGWAEASGLNLLALDLRRVIGRLRCDLELLTEARDLCLEHGLHPRAGKTELSRAELLQGPARLPALQAAIALLEGDRPYQLLAKTAQSEVLAGVSRAAGRNAAEPLLALAEQAGMEGVLDRLLQVVRR